MLINDNSSHGLKAKRRLNKNKTMDASADQEMKRISSILAKAKGRQSPNRNLTSDLVDQDSPE